MSICYLYESFQYYYVVLKPSSSFDEHYLCNKRIQAKQSQKYYNDNYSPIRNVSLLLLFMDTVDTARV